MKEILNIFKFTGRMGRRQFMGGVVLWLAVFLVLVLVAASFWTTSNDYYYGNVENMMTSEELMILSDHALWWGIAWGLLAMVVALVSFTSLMMRRLHDMDRNGWLTLIYIVPCLIFWPIGILAVLVFIAIGAIAKGTPIPNKYGLPQGSAPVYVS